MTNVDNFILSTDAYKLGHWDMYPEGTEIVYSYFESREGATFPYTVFFGLQAIIEKYMTGHAVLWDDLSEARHLSSKLFGSNKTFNNKGWEHILHDHQGRLPLLIKAVPEGTVVPTGNVLMTVENTCPECYWLTNAVESLLTHVWYPSTVATLSRFTKEVIAGYLADTAESSEGLKFMLHDFGYRGASSHESAAIGGAGHLVNFVGTDTLPAILAAAQYYDASFDTTGFSVPATEHSVMTSKGKEGEFEVVDQLLENYPSGVLSVVADSYNIYKFVDTMCDQFKDRIMARDGVFVIRPDSLTKSHRTPGDLTVWIAQELYQKFGGHINRLGFKVLDPHVRILWGDGIDTDGVKEILENLKHSGFSAENMVFGMGGGLLQKVNRDTQRFAFKSSAQKRNGEWHDVFKETPGKNSKKGRLMLYRSDYGEFATYPLDEFSQKRDMLQTVFENGKLVNPTTFDEVRKRAEL